VNLAETLHLHARWTAALTPEQRARVLSDLAVQHVAAGKSVCRKGEEVDAWIGVLGGLVKLSSSAPDGRTLSFTGVPPGGWFGEGSLLKQEPRRYDASALRDSIVARLPRSTFTWLLDSSIPFNRFLLIQLNERLAQFIARIEYEYLLDPEAKLARCIADLFNPLLYPGSGLRLEISQAEIALLVGTSRQRVNQSLHALEKAGLLAIEYGAIRVLDLAGLRRFGT
jgi:CRP/FNR family transcriptional regulator, cyclic AMP receptor protein